MKDLIILLRTHRKTIVTATLLLILGLQVANISRVLEEASSHLSLVTAFDDDARLVLSKTLQTRWYKDNGMAGYGPFYFRVAHTLASLIPGHPLSSLETSSQAVERGTHFALLFLSLVSVFGLSLLLAVLLTADWNVRLLITMALISAFLVDPTYALFLVRAHPDHMFAFLVTLANFLTLYSLSEPRKHSLFKSAASMWGLATGTKLSVVFNMPALLLMWIPPFKKNNWKTAGHFALWAFLGYFIICFPQSIVLDRPVKFLFSQSAYSTTPDFSSVLEWLQLLIHQIWRPTVVLLFSWLCLQPLTKNPSKIKIPLNRRFYILIFLPFLLLLTRKVTSSHDHYMFPFVGTFLLAFVLALQHFKLPKDMPKHASSIWVALPLLVLAVWGLVPASLSNAKIQMNACRAEAVQFENELRQLIQAQDKAHVDPYIPLNTREYADGQTEVEWSISWDRVNAQKQNLLILNSKYFSRYHNPDAVTLTNIQNANSDWKNSVDFYSSFIDKQQAVDPQGRTWKQIKNVPGCHWEVWRRE